MPCPTCQSPWPARRGELFGGTCTDSWHDKAQKEEDDQGMVETLLEEPEPPPKKPAPKTRKTKK